MLYFDSFKHDLFINIQELFLRLGSREPKEAVVAKIRISDSYQTAMFVSGNGVSFTGKKAA